MDKEIEFPNPEEPKDAEALVNLVVEDDGHDKERSWISDITMEPVWFATIIPLTISISAFQNMFLERACTVDLGHSIEECIYSDDTSEKIKLELDSQRIIAAFSMASSFVGGFLQCMTLLFFGPWCDTSGMRKPAILLPIFGMMCTYLISLILQVFPEVSSSWSIALMTLPMSICGSNPLLMTAAFSYLGDICFKTGRCATTVMGSNSAAISGSTFIGFLLAPILLRSTGFVGVFLICTLLQIVSMFYVCLKVKDINVSKKKANIFDFSLPWQSQKCLFKKRKGNQRKNVLLMVFVPCMTTINFVTEKIILYLYLRYEFGWTEVEYGMFSAFGGIVQFFGTIITVKFLKHCLKLEDETIGLIGGISQFLSTCVLILSSKPWTICLSPIVGFLSRAVLIAEKPVLNKQIIANEQGKLNSITAILDKLLSLVAIPLAHYVYFFTLSFMPKCFLFLSLFASVVQIFCYISVDREPLKKYDKELQIKK